MKGRSIILACAVAVLLIGSLAMGGQCRLVDGRRSYGEDGHGVAAGAGASNVTAVAVDEAESKIHVKFCVSRDCYNKGEPIRDTSCICCMALPDFPCWDSFHECQDNCPEVGSS